MRVLRLVAAFAMLITAVGAGAVVDPPDARADAPVAESFTFTFSDINPCTGELIDITITVDALFHEHENVFVALIERSGATSDGFVMVAGHEAFVEVLGDKAKGTFVDQWRRSDGAKFKVHGNFLFDIAAGELAFDKFRIGCIGR